MINYAKYFINYALCGALLTGLQVNAQTLPAPEPALPKAWHLMDLKTQGYYGISLNRAYLALKGKKSKPVVVAVIDSGIDTLQADLKSVLWVNPKEKLGKNGKDDDNNGYIDDVHGWDFLGGPNGKADFSETTEEVREYNRLKGKYLQLTDSAATDKKEFAYWQKVKAVYDTTFAHSSEEGRQLSQILNVLMTTSGYIKQALKLAPNATFKLADLNRLKGNTEALAQSKNVWSYFFTQEGPTSTNEKIIKELNQYQTKLNNDISPDLDARKRIVGDDPNVWDGKPYGNNKLKFEDASHGTGVAGLIGAVRGNKYGVDGIANNVRIMAIKAVPNGDEYDKDIANAIRYAVDNGARVVNMSFGKKLSPHKDWVDAAFKYAADHDVLLVQAAGNDHQDVDAKPQYPNDTFEDGSVTDAANLLNVGASSAKPNANLPGTFSNYGQSNVDVFAPGVKVTSIDKDAEFNTADGTSFASPITAGLAALLLEYYPNLSARQLKQIIMKSAKPLTGTMVFKPGSTTEKVDFTTLSKSGGVINAYEAVILAGKTVGERKK
jgi:cell wall-associated protease